MKKLWQIAQKINIEPRRIHFDEPMARHTTMRIGGPADIFISVTSETELRTAILELEVQGIPVWILGGGANVLVGDRGIRGAVIDTGGIDRVLRTEAGLRSGCGISMDRLCLHALALGLSGLEDFYGMPGTLGGAVFMNARCYERDISNILNGVTVMSRLGETKRLAAADLSWSYKRSPFQPGEPYSSWLITDADLRLSAGDPVQMAKHMRGRKMDRTLKGHYRHPSAGSMFKNDRRFGKPSGVLIDNLGLKGFRIGDAGISPLHANIFVNLGSATARDMRLLIEHTRDAVEKAYGFVLEPEVLFIGEF